MLLVEVRHVQIGGVSRKISDEYHFVSVFVSSSSERLMVFHFLFVCFLSLVVLVLDFIFNS